MRFQNFGAYETNVTNIFSDNDADDTNFNGWVYKKDTLDFIMVSG